MFSPAQPVKMEAETDNMFVDVNADKSKPRPKKQGGNATTNTRTIKTLGSNMERVAQACDRCRAKKTKCDGKRPACSNCEAVGFKCIVSDKLSRRAFPKGYTETLEERIRQLEKENEKLLGLLDMRDEQLGMLNPSNSLNSSAPASTTAESATAVGLQLQSDAMSSNGSLQTSQAKSGTPVAPTKLTSSNLYLHDEQGMIDHSHQHGDACACGCSNAHSVHERPVSIAGSVYDGNLSESNVFNSSNAAYLSEDDDDGLLSADETASIISGNTVSNINLYNKREQLPAPGAFAAATAFAQMRSHHENDNQQALTSLVAASIPRSTEETLFIPTLLAKICQQFGYSSKTAILTANSLALLKDTSASNTTNPQVEDRINSLSDLILNRPLGYCLSLSEVKKLVCDLLSFPASRLDLDQLITIYCQDWGVTLPIVDKNTLLRDYVDLLKIIENQPVSEDTTEFRSRISKFGAYLVIVISLGLLSNKYTYLRRIGHGADYSALLNYYDLLIHQFIQPNCVLTRDCSMQSLQILSLSLLYCLVIGDITTCYELRGRVISMAQQLRLHRCPAAVLGITSNSQNVELQRRMQGTRRILFWCVYCLDTYSSFSLGIPRLLKDFEVECAMPFSGKKAGGDEDDDEDNENILIVNNTKLSILGKVSKMTLSFMMFCKVLGIILDSVFSRSGKGDTHSDALKKDRMLDCWRRDLPTELKFEIDVNGFSLKDKDQNTISGDFGNYYNRQQLTLIYLFYHAKILIYLPTISKHGNHHDVGLSQKEILTKGQSDVSGFVTAISMIQQSSIQILEVLKCLSNSSVSNAFVLPIPLNIPREQARIALWVSKGALDYTKGGPLHQQLKQLLLDSVSILNEESSFDIPSSITKHSMKVLELAILSILGLNLNKMNVFKRKPSVKTLSPIRTKPGVSRDGLEGKNGFTTSQSIFRSPLSTQPVQRSNVGEVPGVGSNNQYGTTGTTPQQYQQVPSQLHEVALVFGADKLPEVGASSPFSGPLFQARQHAQQVHFQQQKEQQQIQEKLQAEFDRAVGEQQPYVGGVSSSSSSNNGNSVSPNAGTGTGAALSGDAEFSAESLESILEFDPFKVNLNGLNYANEFAADGSLGLVPFLDLTRPDLHDDDDEPNSGLFNWL